MLRCLLCDLCFSSFQVTHSPHNPNLLTFPVMENNSAVATQHATATLINIPRVSQKKSHCLNENLLIVRQYFCHIRLIYVVFCGGQTL